MNPKEPLRDKPVLVLIDAKEKVYIRYVHKKVHLQARSGHWLSAVEVEQFRVNPGSMIEDPKDAA